MVGESVLHSPNVPVIVIEGGRVSLTRAAVVHNDILPARARDRRAIDLIADRTRQITVTRAAAAAAATAAAKQAGPETSRLFIAILFDR